MVLSQTGNGQIKHYMTKKGDLCDASSRILYLHKFDSISAAGTNRFAKTFPM